MRNTSSCAWNRWGSGSAGRRSKATRGASRPGRRLRGVELCIYTDDVDAAAAQLRGLGARELALPADQPWGERLAYFLDPDGRPLHVAQPLTST